VVATLDNGLPLLLEARLGEGRIWILASALDGRANDLTLQPAFLPFIDRSLRWLSGASERVSLAQVDAAHDLRRTRSASSSVEVIGPDGRRAISIEEAARASSLALDRAGFWEIRRPGGRAEMVAVNIDRRESDLALMPAESAELWQGAPAAPSSAASTQTAEAARQLWPWFVALACAMALAEIWIAAKHLKTAETANEEAR
jgi:hypothetical protein